MRDKVESLQRCDQAIRDKAPFHHRATGAAALPSFIGRATGAPQTSGRLTKDITSVARAVRAVLMITYAGPQGIIIVNVSLLKGRIPIFREEGVDSTYSVCIYICMQYNIIYIHVHKRKAPAPVSKHLRGTFGFASSFISPVSVQVSYVPAAMPRRFTLGLTELGHRRHENVVYPSVSASHPDRTSNIVEGAGASIKIASKLVVQGDIGVEIENDGAAHGATLLPPASS